MVKRIPTLQQIVVSSRSSDKMSYNNVLEGEDNTLLRNVGVRIPTDVQSYLRRTKASLKGNVSPRKKRFSFRAEDIVVDNVTLLLSQFSPPSHYPANPTPVACIQHLRYGKNAVSHKQVQFRPIVGIKEYRLTIIFCCPQ
jgi:hypothetical protein